MDNIPNVIMLDNIKKKYNIQKKENEVIPVVGEDKDQLKLTLRNREMLLFMEMLRVVKKHS